MAFVLLHTGCSRRQAFGTSKPLKPIFDVPELVHKNIDQLNALLSTSTQQDIPLPAIVLANGYTTRERSFRQDTLTLFVTYNEQTRKVFHVFLTTDHQRVADVTPLMQLGNLEGNYPRLLIEPKVIQDAGYAYRGIWVCTKKQDVQLKQY
ncbi:hypothetical protein [uncultured Hymenobacter sp.]|uniref:hypothetical protein n=1 Tax=uncultured Hymenobacter sp. TaxID=170016 RepID=UPI0035C9D79A